MVLWLKGVAIGFAAGALTMGIVSLVSYRSDGAEPSESAAAIPQPAEPMAPAPKVQGLATEAKTPGAQAAPAPATTLSDPVPSTPTSATQDEGEGTGTRSGELSALNAVRAALAAKNGRAALVELDQYEGKYPSLSFGLAAQLLRIEALTAIGRPQAAKELASAFLAAHPDSSHAPRLRAFVAGEALPE